MNINTDIIASVVIGLITYQIIKHAFFGVALKYFLKELFKTETVKKHKKDFKDKLRAKLEAEAKEQKE